jgi:putative holliday junction resolvase
VGRILGIDYGNRRVGMAISDPLSITAQPRATWRRTDESELIPKIVAFVLSEGVDRVVVGYPITLKGTKSSRSLATERFAGKLADACPVPVSLWDERLTTVQAHRVLHLMGKAPSRNRDRVDQIAAALMLQSYLDGRSGTTTTESKDD